MYCHPIKHVCLISLILWALHSSTSTAEDLVVGAYHYPPFMNETLNNGIYQQLTQAIEQHSDFTFTWRFYPYARVDRLFSMGKVHLEIGSSPLWNVGKPVPGLSTDYFYTQEDVAVYNINNLKPSILLEDIKDQDIGVVRGYSFPQFTQAFEQGLVRRIEATDEMKLLDLLLNERIDQVFISKQVFLYLKSHNPRFSTLIMGDVVGHYDVAIRVHPDKAYIVPSLNKAIQTLKDKGLIETLFERIEEPIKKPAEAG